eukprot:jgi/Mesvir1/20321/Mv19911-RA.1
MVQIYGEPLLRRHYAGAISAASCFRLGGLILCIVVTFIVAYATKGLWVKVGSFREQPDVHFSYQALLILESRGGPGSTKVWSTSHVLNEALASSLVPCSLQATEEDYNQDGLVDTIDIKLLAPAAEEVHSVKLLLGFTYELHERVDLTMQSAAFISESSPLPGKGLFVDGELKLRLREPLDDDDKHRRVYDQPVFDPGHKGELRGLDMISLTGILSAYAARNETTVLDAPFRVWESGQTPGFAVTARVRIPSAQQIEYNLGTLEMFKLGWVQYIAIFVVFWWCFYWVEYVTFRYRILTTRVISDAQIKLHHF